MNNVMKAEFDRTSETSLLKNDFKKMKAAYNSKPYPNYKERKEVLLRLKAALIENEQAIYDALK